MRKHGLDLLGNGYRVAAFHLGILKKLDELGILNRLEVLSAISRSSFSNVLYCLNKYYFSTFEQMLYQTLQGKNKRKKPFWSLGFFKTLVLVVIFLCPAFYFLLTGQYGISISLFVLFIVCSLYFQLSVIPLSKELEEACEHFFYKKTQLSPPPELVIGFSNSQLYPLLKTDSFTCGIIIKNDTAGNILTGRKVYKNLSTYNRQIAYISPDYDIEKCIPRFINDLQKGAIPGELIAAHHLHRDWVEHPAHYADEIADYLEEITDYKSIIKPSETELRIGRSAQPGCSPMSGLQIDSLVKHAAALTELELKLYFPGLLN